MDINVKVEVKSENGEEQSLDWTGLPEQLDSLPCWKDAYRRYYCTSFSTPKQNLDTSLWIHSNNVSVVYLSPTHSIYSEDQPNIKLLNFQITPKLNRLENKMSGKGKRGAQLLQPDSILCFIETENAIYPVRSGIFGKLIEINPLIINDPNLILRDNTTMGWIAIILQDLRKIEVNLLGMVQESLYNGLDGIKNEPNVEVTMIEEDDDDNNENNVKMEN